MSLIFDRSLPSNQLTNGQSVGVLQGMTVHEGVVVNPNNHGPYASVDYFKSGAMNGVGSFGDMRATASSESRRSQLLSKHTSLQRTLGAISEQLKQLKAKVGDADPAYVELYGRARALANEGQRVRMAIMNDEAQAPTLLDQALVAARDLTNAVIAQLDIVGRALAKGSENLLTSVGKGAQSTLTQTAGALKWIGVGALVLGSVLLLGGAVPGFSLFKKSQVKRARGKRSR